MARWNRDGGRRADSPGVSWLMVALIAMSATLLAGCVDGSGGRIPDPVVVLEPTVATSDTAPPSSLSANPPLPSQPQPTPVDNDLAIDWDDPSKVVNLGDGWSISGCIGDGPFLCVERDGTPIGAIEALALQIESLDFVDPVDSQKGQLDALSRAFIESLRADRTTTCPDFVFDAIEPSPFPLGESMGVVYGFVGAAPDGKPTEMVLQYAAVVGDSIVTLVAIGEDVDGCLGRIDISGFTTEELSRFRPYLERTLRVSPLPDLAP